MVVVSILFTQNFAALIWWKIRIALLFHDTTEKKCEHLMRLRSIHLRFEENRIFTPFANVAMHKVELKLTKYP